MKSDLTKTIRSISLNNSPLDKGDSEFIKVSSQGCRGTLFYRVNRVAATLFFGRLFLRPYSGLRPYIGLAGLLCDPIISDAFLK